MKRRLLCLLLCLLLGGCAAGAAPPVETAPPSLSQGRLCVHFINVGQGDSTLLECDGVFALIDGGAREEGASVVSYLEQQGVEQLAAILCTHGHEDHVGGLSTVLERFPVDIVYAPAGNMEAGSFQYFARRVHRAGLEIAEPIPGDTIPLGQACITVLGPVTGYEGLNDTSLVLRVDYGQTAFLFAGDMESSAEADLMSYWEDQPDILDVDVLKVGHHGSGDASGYRFLYRVTADYGILSVGQGNDYGHPHGDALARLNQAGVTLLRTDELGTITAVSDGAAISFAWEQDDAQPQYAGAAQPEAYIGNLRSHNLHSPLCDGLPAERNRIVFDSYQEALDAGYIPCRDCLDPAA